MVKNLAFFTPSARSVTQDNLPYFSAQKYKKNNKKRVFFSFGQKKITD